jgi:hypothetical protein
VVKPRVRIYIEGGSTGRFADNDFRRGWKKFLDGLHRTAMSNGFHSLEVIRGQGRGNALRKFEKHHREYPDDLCVLLVDSEGPVTSHQNVWDVVANREGDRWIKPSWATENDLFLMVQFVETWLLTDPEALRLFFGPEFDASKLPNTNLEARSKDDIERALRSATKNCRKGSYKHGHAHQVLAHVRPENVQVLKHGKRLFETVTKLIKGEIRQRSRA